VDSLPEVGGQCAKLYPEKPIYDIPAFPVVGAQELIDRLLEQIKPFKPDIHLGQMVSSLERKTDGRFLLGTSTGQQFDTGTVILAAGLGAFQPRRMRAMGSEDIDGRQLHYQVTKKEDFRGKNLLILGGGDSALDWTLELAGIAGALTLVHRRTEYRGQPASVKKIKALSAAGKLNELQGTVRRVNSVDGQLQNVEILLPDGSETNLEADEILVFWGLSPNLGPIADWGLEVNRRQVPVDTEKFQTSEPGIFAVGDINTYPGKKKLILSGFHETALAAFAVQQHLFPEKKVRLQYTTTSSAMHKLLGVED
jgi:thioredoxin reductase (NADPH)